MSRHYQIWDRQSEVKTAGGRTYSPEEWIELNQYLKDPDAVCVLYAGRLNGKFIGELSDMKLSAELQGAVFDDNLTDDELLQAIEDFQNEMNQPVDPSTIPPTVEERTAAALEFIAMNSLPDQT